MESEIFSEIEEKSETEGNASLPQGGWTPPEYVNLVWEILNIQTIRTFYRRSWAEAQGGMGDGHPKTFEVGDGPCIRPPPNISRSGVIGCVCKYTN